MHSNLMLSPGVQRCTDDSLAALALDRLVFGYRKFSGPFANGCAHRSIRQLDQPALDSAGRWRGNSVGYGDVRSLNAMQKKLPLERAVGLFVFREDQQAGGIT